MKLLVVVAATAVGTTALAQLPAKQSNAGDSISQGFDANDLPWDHPDVSWAQGTNSSINSVFMRYKALVPNFTQQPESVSGAEMVGGGDSFAAQSSRICAQNPRPQHVSVLLGGNDVCNRAQSSTSDATANMYTVQTWVNALDAGLDQLAACLPAGSTIHVMSVPRIDFLYAAGTAKSWWCSNVVWPLAGVCTIVTNESSASRREQIGARINAYNDAIVSELAKYNANSNGKNPNALHFATDWRGSIEQGMTNTSTGTYRFSAGDISDVDCFHPNETGQAKIACAAWDSNPDKPQGAALPSGCF